jgi:hypothetical protein
VCEVCALGGKWPAGRSSLNPLWGIIAVSRRIDAVIAALFGRPARLHREAAGAGQHSAWCRRPRAIALSLHAPCSAGGSRVTCRNEPSDPREPLVDPLAWRGGVLSPIMQPTPIRRIDNP